MHHQLTALYPTMPDTIAFYNQSAEDFFAATASIDTSPLYKKFLSLLPAEAHILDAGCGSGRDTKAFMDMGYQVTAFDGSSALARMASAHTGLNVQHSLFKNFHSLQLFDGIWACASLLHTPYQALADTFEHLTKFLKRKGVFYCSFKSGNNEQIERSGRLFTNLNATGLQNILEDTKLHIEQDWITQDLRPDREKEQWYNAIVRKA